MDNNINGKVTIKNIFKRENSGAGEQEEEEFTVRNSAPIRKQVDVNIKTCEDND